jgi:hypothetical protein
VFSNDVLKLEYFEKESKYYLCSIKVNYLDNNYIFYIKSDKIDFCKYTWFSNTLDSFTGRRINRFLINYYVKKKIKELIMQHKQENEKINNTIVRIIDGNFNVDIDYIPYCKLTTNNMNDLLQSIKYIIDTIKKTNKQYINVLHKFTLCGQSISNSNREIIIKKLKENGLINVEFYKEETI